jgi:hypothetical protein
MTYRNSLNLLTDRMTIHSYKYHSFSLVDHSRPRSTIQYKTLSSNFFSFILSQFFSFKIDFQVIYVMHHHLRPVLFKMFLIFYKELLLDKRNHNKSLKAYYTHTSVCILLYRSASSIPFRLFPEIFSVRAHRTSK